MPVIGFLSSSSPDLFASRLRTGVGYMLTVWIMQRAKMRDL
jgi:hypothetical protein